MQYEDVIADLRYACSRHNTHGSKCGLDHFTDIYELKSDTLKLLQDATLTYAEPRLEMLPPRTAKQMVAKNHGDEPVRQKFEWKFTKSTTTEIIVSHGVALGFEIGYNPPQDTGGVSAKFKASYTFNTSNRQEDTEYEEVGIPIEITVDAGCQREVLLVVTEGILHLPFTGSVMFKGDYRHKNYNGFCTLVSTKSGPLDDLLSDSELTFQLSGEFLVEYAEKFDVNIGENKPITSLDFSDAGAILVEDRPLTAAVI